MARRATQHYAAHRSAGELMIYREFGRRLQARMMELGWGQSELARRATDQLPKPAKGQVQGHAIGRDRISSYIRGKYLPRPEGLEAIAKALRCDPEDLLPSPSDAPRPRSAPEEGPVMELKWIQDGRVAIRLNRVVSETTATEITAILAAEDKKK